MTNTISYEEKQLAVDKSLNYKGIRYYVILNGEYALLKDKLILKHSFFINPFLLIQKTIIDIGY